MRSLSSFCQSVRPSCAWTAGLLVLVTLLVAAPAALALQGAAGIHDPSTIIKRDGVYHVWGTGDQIYHLTSTDLVSWRAAAPVFAAGTWPGWINSYVTGFKGFFWAPECVFRNGKYYLYYSCSTGQRPCAIGVATSTDLTTWTDQGMVVFSDNSTAYGSIDPAVFSDASGRVWMSFGSHLSGIWHIELDPTTGKRLNTTAKNVAGTGSNSEHEAAYVMQHGGYYYLFYNRGVCCAGLSSTYYVQMGRSRNPDGPFVDQNGVDLLAGGGSTFLAGQGNLLGPGHVGLFAENNTNYLTYHYYDGSRSGAPTLALGSLSWDAATDWPAATQDWLPNGTYQVRGVGSGKVWAAAGCPATAGSALVQSAATGQSCQQWRFTAQGSGVYKITNVLSGLNADVTSCAETAGTPLGLRADSPLDCQRFRIERAADGTLVFASTNGNRVVEVPNAATADGQQLGLWDYNGCACQHWIVEAAGGTATATRTGQDAQIQLFPNPALEGSFTVQLPPGTAASVSVADLRGRIVLRQQLRGSGQIRAGLGAGAYVVRIATARGVTTRKLLTF